MGWEFAAADPSIVIISERRTARGCSQQGVRFDPDMPQTIRLEFAKSNTKVSKPKPAVATAAPAAHPALMHPLTGRKYRRTHTPPGARSTAHTRTIPTEHDQSHDLCLCRSLHYIARILTTATTVTLFNVSRHVMCTMGASSKRKGQVSVTLTRTTQGLAPRSY